MRETVSDATSRFLREALRRTVAEGTGKAAQVEGYDVGGKTGTAEKVGRNKEDYVVSFCGFAPTDHPKVLVYVVIDEPNVEKQDSSSYASKVFSQVMGDILPYLNVFPDTGEEEGGLTQEEILENEGVNQIGGEEEETQPETPVYETDENAPPVETAEDGSVIPSDLPYIPAGEEETESIPQTRPSAESSSSEAGEETEESSGSREDDTSAASPDPQESGAAQ